jgi:multidrug resistance efflux pump
VAFTLGGRVEEIRVATGDTVAAGEVLARLDRSPFQNSLSQAQANLARVESMLDQANRSLARVAALGNAATREELEIRESAVLELEAGRREADVAVVEANRQIREATPDGTV